MNRIYNNTLPIHFNSFTKKHKNLNNDPIRWNGYEFGGGSGGTATIDF